MSARQMLLVQPAQLLVVTYEDGNFRHDVLAITCRYVPVAQPGGQRALAVEVLADPAQPQPTEPYYCPPERLRRILIAPKRIKKIRPFR